MDLPVPIPVRVVRDCVVLTVACSAACSLIKDGIQPFTLY